ncbi:hypothetical protein P886_3509 [Alteromonadaceae bacterium 2753L.S.0a.02]|nr:hypothetical protein P886_3509 [Alteromonadaceae bacterium 2753L.S.0a.02]
MKVKIRVSKRFNLMVTLTACGAALAMMVVRFRYPVEKLLESFWIVLLLLVALLAGAALVGALLYWLTNRDSTVELPPKEIQGHNKNE